MRYDAESGKIHIGLREFVSVARRRIATAMPYDEDEPYVCDAGRLGLRAIIGDVEREVLHFGFFASGYPFELSMTADGISGNEITVAREIESSPERPRRDEMAEVRGEGYVMAHALCEMCG